MAIGWAAVSADLTVAWQVSDKKEVLAVEQQADREEASILLLSVGGQKSCLDFFKKEKRNRIWSIITTTINKFVSLGIALQS